MPRACENGTSRHVFAFLPTGGFEIQETCYSLGIFDSLEYSGVLGWAEAGRNHDGIIDLVSARRNDTIVDRFAVTRSRS